MAGAATAATPTLTVRDEYVVEGVAGGTKDFTVGLTLSEPAAGVTVRVTVATQDGTAKAGTDYVAKTEQVSITPGKVYREFTVQLLGDAVTEGDETFNLVLSAPIGATIADGTGAVLVIDDDYVGGSGPVGPGEPRNCSDNNPYTTDTFDAAAGYCKHAVIATKKGADLDGDRWKASQAGGTDCNDANAAVYPTATEIAGDGIDNNCDGITDGGVRDCSDGYPYTTDKYSKKADRCTHTLLTTADLDGDGWVAAQVGGADCNDASATVNPGRAEVSGNGIDDNCDGIIDGGSAPPTTEAIRIIPGSPYTCPKGDVCTQLVVTCEGTEPVRGWVATAAPMAAQPRGVIALFSGARGENFWGVQKESAVDDLQKKGFEVNRVAWPDGWLPIFKLTEAGPDVAACRPAAATQWVHDTRYAPMGLNPADYVCGFCVGGNSGGGAQAAYTLAEYELESIIDAAVITSGPSFASLAEGCLGTPQEFSLEDASRELADLSYGYAREDNGPCFRRDPSWEQTWREDSINDGADDFYYPKTRVEVILGGTDTTTVPPGAHIYVDHLEAAGTNVTETTYPNAGHGLVPMLNDPQALAGIIAAFTYGG